MLTTTAQAYWNSAGMLGTSLSEASITAMIEGVYPSWVYKQCTLINLFGRPCRRPHES